MLRAKKASGEYLSTTNGIMAFIIYSRRVVVVISDLISIINNILLCMMYDVYSCYSSDSSILYHYYS